MRTKEQFGRSPLVLTAVNSAWTTYVCTPAESTRTAYLHTFIPATVPNPNEKHTFVSQKTLHDNMCSKRLKYKVYTDNIRLNHRRVCKTACICSHRLGTSRSHAINTMFVSQKSLHGCEYMCLFVLTTLRSPDE